MPKKKPKKLNTFSVTTKRGDLGETSMYSGERASKSSPYFKACGDVDELCSALGVARALSDSSEIQLRILHIQRLLFVVGSEIATKSPKLETLEKRIDEQAVQDLTKLAEVLESQVTLPKGFVVPGNHLVAAQVDFSRTICRRAERAIVELYKDQFIANHHLIAWMNRLSDYLYLMCRYIEMSYTMVKQ